MHSMTFTVPWMFLAWNATLSQFFDGLRHDKCALAHMAVCPYAFGTETRVRAVNKFLASEIPQYFFFQRFQGFLLICIAGKQGKCEGDAVPVHENHTDPIPC